jgi:hypothetical protein
MAKKNKTKELGNNIPEKENIEKINNELPEKEKTEESNKNISENEKQNSYKLKEEKRQKEELEIYLKNKVKKNKKRQLKEDKIEKAIASILNPTIRNKKIIWINRNNKMNNSFRGFYNNELLFEIEKGMLSFKFKIKSEKLIDGIVKKEINKQQINEENLTELERAKSTKKQNLRKATKTSTDIYKLQIFAEKLLKENINCFIKK